jgi:hypothetical protein
MLYLGEATIGGSAGTYFRRTECSKQRKKIARPPWVFRGTVTCGSNFLRISRVWSLDPSSTRTPDPTKEAPLQRAQNRFLSKALVVLGVHEQADKGL